MIPTELYFWLITMCAMIYAGISQFVREKLVDMERMKGIQKEMNELNKQYFDAIKKNNTKLMDSIKVKQDKIIPEFNGMMMGQMKVMLVVIVIFMGFMWALGAVDPFLGDDTQFEFSAASNTDGQWCGEVPLGPNTGPWYVDVKAFAAEAEKSERGITIFYKEKSQFLPSGTQMGEEMEVIADKEIYAENENAIVCASPPAGTDRVVASANGGTWFHIPLPFEIPFFNTRTLNGANIWFILVALVGGLGIAKLKKTNDTKLSATKAK